MTRQRAVVVALTVVLTSLVWLGAVPWDLSEIDGAGRPIEGGGDDNLWRVIVSMAAMSVMVGAVSSRWPRHALASGIAGCVTICVWFAWRASSARTDGANLWIAGLLIVVIPLALLAGAVGAGAGVRIARKAELDARAGEWE